MRRHNIRNSHIPACIDQFDRVYIEFVLSTIYIHSFDCSSVRSIVFLYIMFYIFVPSTVRSFVQSFVHSFLHMLIRSDRLYRFTLHSVVYIGHCPFICLFGSTIIHSFVRPSERPFVHSLVRSFVRSFVYMHVCSISLIVHLCMIQLIRLPNRLFVTCLFVSSTTSILHRVVHGSLFLDPTRPDPPKR